MTIVCPAFLSQLPPSNAPYSLISSPKLTISFPFIIVEYIHIHTYMCVYSLLNALGVHMYTCSQLIIWDWTTYVGMHPWKKLTIPPLVAINHLQLFFWGWHLVDFPCPQRHISWCCPYASLVQVTLEMHKSLLHLIQSIFMLTRVKILRVQQRFPL